jgi:aldose sugar dehydrogenase
MSKIKFFNVRIVLTALLFTFFGSALYLLQVFNVKDLDGNQLFSNNKVKNLEQVKSVDYEVKAVAEGLIVPWSIAFSSESRMIVTERPGRVRLVIDGKLQEKPLHVFDEVASQDEEGLMGVTIDPDYAKNKYLFFMYAYRKDNELKIKVVRMADTGESLVAPVTLIDNIACTQNHAGGRLAFGPDKKLYITTGDATNQALPLDLNSPNGKVLRMNNDGTIPNDNPFPNSLVWSYGHRNSQGLAWDTRNGALLSTEHGPSIFDGPTGGDELNEIKKGANYGWPTVSHGRKLAGAEQELIQFTPAVAPGGMLFYTGNEFPQFKNSILFAGLATRGIYQVNTTTTLPVQYINYQKIPNIDVGRIRDVVQSPDGKLYFLSSNTDYRGTPKPGDDKLYQLVPKK